MRLIKEAIKAIRENSRSCAYIYNDGILVRSDKEIKVNKQTATIERWYAIPGDTRLTSCRYTGDLSSETVKIIRVVCHNADVLLDGLARMNVSFHNTSEAMRKAGYSCTSTTITTESGAVHHSHSIDGILSDDFSPQTESYCGTKVQTFRETIDAIRNDKSAILVCPELPALPELANVAS